MRGGGRWAGEKSMRAGSRGVGARRGTWSAFVHPPPAYKHALRCHGVRWYLDKGVREAGTWAERKCEPSRKRHLLFFFTRLQSYSRQSPGYDSILLPFDIYSAAYACSGAPSPIAEAGFE